MPSKLTLIFCLGALALSPRLNAERYAILIGISEYPDLGPKNYLEAPKEDVERLEAILVDRWYYRPANITKLVDGAATKANILRSLDDLIEKEFKPGDVVFWYFSGHGTSALDPRITGSGIPMDSGALIPADAGVGAPEKIFDQFIVGGRDLRHRFIKLNEKVSVFVVIDACYSGTSVKGVKKGLRAREVALPEFVRGKKLERHQIHKIYDTAKLPPPREGFPYRNLIYLSASGQAEKSYEATAKGIDDGEYETLDGKPHGLLTDALLRGMEGEADADRDGKITYGELYQFATLRVSDYEQNPQLLPNDKPAVKAKLLFNVQNPVRHVETVSVSLQPSARGLAARFSPLSAIRMVPENQADFRIEKTGDVYKAVPRPNAPLPEFQSDDVTQFVDRLSHAARVKAIRDWRYPKGELTVAIDMMSDQLQFAVDEQVKFQISADQPSHLLLININAAGEVSVMFKSSGREDAKKPVSPAIFIAPPVGQEYMKLFGFVQPPSGWNFVKSDGALDAPRVRALVDLLRRARGDRAESLRGIVTVTGRKEE